METRTFWLLRIWAGTGLSLFATTWRLWTPQHTYPQVPLLAIGRALPGWIDWLACLAILFSLIAVLASRRNSVTQVALFAFAASTALLVVIDQHRFQPWTYQFILLALVFAAMNGGLGLLELRALTISVYLFSALSKFDYQFLHTLGQQFLQAAVALIGLTPEHWPGNVKLLAAALFPTIELLVAVGLCFSVTRRTAIAFAIVMHVGLLLILGPIGLGHHAAVLIWNLFFIAQVALLFCVGIPDTDCEVKSTRTPSLISRSVRVVMFGAVLLPLLEPFDLVDHWPAWGLYSPRNSRVLVFVHAQAENRLPSRLSRHLETNDGQPWRRLRIDRWSLAELSAPIYPQDRYQLGVALAVMQRYELDRDLRVIWQSKSQRWQGMRTRHEMRSREQIEAFGQRFRLNWRPHRFSSGPVQTQDEPSLRH